MNGVKRFLKIITVCFVIVFLFYTLFLPQTAYADTSIYRSAGWVSTDGSPAYLNTTGCQVSNDGLYCSRINASSYGNLYFSSFGNLEDFGILPGSYITKLHIRVKGKNNVVQYVGVNSAKNYMPFLAACNTPGDLWPVYLGQNDNVVEDHTFTSSNGLTNCVTANNIDQERLTFRLNHSSGSSWNADIDNFEIAFDYNLSIYPWKIQGITSIPRNLNQSVLLTNGKVLVAGGIYVAQSTNIVEIFTPGSNEMGTWTHVMRMNHDRKFHTLHLIENQQTDSSNVIAIGGAAEGCSCIRNSAELYDPSSNTWIMTPNLNYPRAFHGSSVLEDGNILVSGGASNATIHNSTEIYDTATNTWTIKVPLNTARAHHRQVTFMDAQGNSKVMVIGGRDSTGKQLSSTEIYDLSSNTWILGPSMNSIRYDFSAIKLHDGRILVVGGGTGDSEVFDPATNQWTTYPTSYNFRQGSVVELGSETNYKALAAGSFPVTTNAMLFDPQTNLWTNTTPMNAPRADFTLTLLKDGTALAANGISSYQQTHTSEIYTSSDVTPPPPPPPLGKTPLILIPGMAGSELQTTEEVEWSQPDGHGGTFNHTYPSQEPVWLNLIEVLKPGEDDYFDILRMNPDGQTSQANIVPNGAFVALAYEGFIDFFTDIGYELNKTLFLFPYDWRRDVGLTASLLDQKIESIKQQTGSESVDIVSHSMGGLAARNYIADSGAAQKVRKLFTIGTPHLGSVDYIKNLMYGGCLSKDPFKKPICFGISPSEIKDVVQNMISGFELAPSQTYFAFYSGEDNFHPFPFRDDRDMDNNTVTGPLNYSAIKTLLTNLDYNTSLFGPSEAFHFLDNNLNDTNGVEVTNIVGSGMPTLGQIIEKYSIDFLGVKIPHRDEISINGDQVVPLFSASLNDVAKTISFLGDTKVFYTEQEHGSLVSSGPALDLVKNILENNSQLPDGVSNNSYSFSGTRVSVHSPVDIHVYDSADNHTGPTSGGDFEANIPGSSYDTLDDAKFIWLPDDGQYSIKFEATDKGSFDFKIRKFENDTLSKETLYKDIPLTNSTKAEAQFDSSSYQSPIIYLDEDGNGTIDQNIDPSAILTGNAVYDQTPPQTAIQLSGVLGDNGWYKSDVIVTLNSLDEEDGSGILETEYSLDNGQTINDYIAPFTISTEKINKLKFRSIDNAGNEENPKELEIKIDKTLPEAKIFADQDLLDLVVIGVDQNQTTVESLDNPETKKKDDSVYVIEDLAGNTLTMDVRDVDKDKKDSFRIHSLQYNQDLSIQQPDNKYSASYKGKKEKLNLAEQNFAIENEIKIRIKYNASKNQSTIITKEKGAEKVKEIKDGLMLLQIITEKGTLKYSY